MSDKAKRAKDYFHLMPNNWNCAQAIHKAEQDHTGFTDEYIEEHYRSKGGGRAEGGLCGAIYAVRSIVGDNTDSAHKATEQFGIRAGGLTCAQLRDKCGRSCAELVDLAQDVLNEIKDKQE